MGCVHESMAAAAAPSHGPPLHRLVLRPAAGRLGSRRDCRSLAQTPRLAPARQMAAQSAATLTAKRCEPCESDSGSLGYMGLCGSLQQSEVQRLLQEVSGWELWEDEQKRLRLRRRLVARNFAAGLEVCHRIGELAEAEGHHPDVHLTGWNKLTLELWTHARDGITENDFIVAAKINELPLDDLLKTKAAVV